MKTTVVRCTSCGFCFHEYPGKECAAVNWHQPDPSISEEFVRKHANTKQVQIGARLSGEDAALLYSIAHAQGLSMSQMAAHIVSDRLDQIRSNKIGKA